MELKPQDGPQWAFSATSADICIYGGAAGGGKSWSLIFEPLRHCRVKDFSAVIFRRETPPIRNPQGLWDKAVTMYTPLGGTGRESTLDFKVGNAAIKFSHMEMERNMYDWQGAELCYIGFDELTQFTEKQFWYLVGRNRSTCGVRPYVRATCNPDPDSFVAKMVAWYIGDDGYAIPERSGVVRYFIRSNDIVEWGNTREELMERFPETCMNPTTGKVDPRMVKSFTFINSTVYDNKILLQTNPEYLSNLKAQDVVNRERLLKGNWKIRPTAGMYFKRQWFELVSAAPADAVRVRAWDKAATAPHETNRDPDYTAGVKMSRDKSGVYYIEDLQHFRLSSHARDTAIKNTATQDGRGVRIVGEQEPGSAGKDSAYDFIKLLDGFNVAVRTATGDKVTRATPFSAQCEGGNVKIVKCDRWNDTLLNELENFDGSGKGHDDIVDACSLAYHSLKTAVDFSNLGGIETQSRT